MQRLYNGKYYNVVNIEKPLGEGGVGKESVARKEREFLLGFFFWIIQIFTDRKSVKCSFFIFFYITRLIGILKSLLLRKA